jgi:hypothetical protein
MKRTVKTEPVVLASTISGLIVSLASIFDVVLDLDTVQTIVVAVLPIVLSLFARSQVTPTERKPSAR